MLIFPFLFHETKKKIILILKKHIHLKDVASVPTSDLTGHHHLVRSMSDLTKSPA